VYRNVEEVSRFPGLPQRKQLTYSAKQMIAREVRSDYSVARVHNKEKRAKMSPESNVTFDHIHVIHVEFIGQLVTDFGLVNCIPSA
jgi:hypothetical protein